MATRSPRGQRTQGARATGRARLAVATRGRYARSLRTVATQRLAHEGGTIARRPPVTRDPASRSSLALPAPRHAVPRRKSAMTQFLLRERVREEDGEGESRESKRDVSECKRERRGREMERQSV